MTEIVVPTLGESVSSATVARWLKQAGEAVAADEPLVELETDKVTVEVPAPSAGVIESIAADTGAEVAPGAVLGVIGAAGAGTAAAKPQSKAAASGTAAAPTPPPMRPAPGPPSPGWKSRARPRDRWRCRALLARTRRSRPLRR
jgi:2-oxoglutarate dehydrogenase E2 component (dihydrolipoamide succinyltransferase)